MTAESTSNLKGKPRYELHHDQLEETYTIRRVEDIGPFDSREAARQYMLDTTGERQIGERYA